MRYVLLLLLAALAPAVRAQAPPPEFVQVDVQPVKLSGEDPAYPATLRREGIEGRAVVRAWISAEGTVKTIEILRADHPEFGAAAVAAVRTWTFEPASKDGKPVDVWMTIPIRFRIGTDETPPLADTTGFGELGIDPEEDIPETLRMLTPEEYETLMQRLQRTPEQCASLPPRTFVFEGDSLRFSVPLTDDEEVEFAACIVLDTPPPMNEPEVRTPPSSEQAAARAGVRLLMGILERYWLRLSS